MKDRINALRERLHKEIAVMGPAHKDVIKLSNELDELINEYEKTKENDNKCE